MKGEVFRRSYPLTVPWYRRPTEAEIADGASAYARVRDGDLRGTVEIEVDITGLLAKLGDKAMRATGKVAREAGGLVMVRARNVVQVKGGA